MRDSIDVSELRNDDPLSEFVEGSLSTLTRHAIDEKALLLMRKKCKCLLK
jgi:hypothetical protein